METIRLSKLQKRILVTIFKSEPVGTYEEVVWSKRQNTKEIKDLEEMGYEFKNAGYSPLTGKEADELRYSRMSPNYLMGRSVLAFELFNWQDWNRYKENRYTAEIGPWQRYIKKGIPPYYNKRQSTLTRSLQLLAKDNLVVLLHRFDDPVSVYSKTASQRLGITPTDFEKEKEKGLERCKQEFIKLQKDGHYNGWEFEKWFKHERPIQIFGLQTGGWNSPESVYKSNYCHRTFRNISKIRLTDNGINKAKELLKVKSRIPLPNLTFRHSVKQSQTYNPAI
jgi:hypothetical protein